MRESGVDPARLLDTYIGVLDACLRDRPAGMVAGIHVCRGNVKVRASLGCSTQHSSSLTTCAQPDATGFAKGPYDFIAKVLFTRVSADCFYVRRPLRSHLAFHADATLFLAARI